MKPEELLIDVVLRLISGARHVAVGANSPIPAAAAFLAQRRGNGRPYVSLQQSPKHNLFTDGGRLRLVAWRTPRAVYWISNTLTLALNNDQMLAVAASTRPIGR